MLDISTEEGPPAVHSNSYRSGEESGEDGLAVLPRHTKVLVTGNNRTKSVLVGLHGVVTKAVGLGGWHWLVLGNGDEVKLQRNALSVIEAPSGHEEHDDNEDNPFSSGTSLEDNGPRNAFKPRVQPRKPSMLSSRLTTEEPDHTTAAHLAAEHAEFTRMFTDSVDEGSSPTSEVRPSVDLSKLEIAALRRYRRHFKLVEVGPNSTKEQLLRAVGRHFTSHELDEAHVIAAFMQAAKRPRP